MPTRASPDAQRKHVAWAEMHIKRVDDDKRTIKGLATTPTPDRVGDIVDPTGVQFKLPIPLLWQHSHEDPIGWVREAQVSKNGIEITAEIAKGVTTRIETYWQLLKSGLVRGLSIGFRGLPDGVELLDDGWGLLFKKWEWLELSTVTIPANADCSIDAIKAFSEQTQQQKMLRDFMGSTAGSSARSKSSRTGVHADDPQATVPRMPAGGKIMPKKTSDRIVETEEAISAARDDITEIQKTWSDEDRDPTDEESAQIEELEAVIATKSVALETLKRAEKALAVREATRQNAREATRLPAAAKETRPGDLLVKMGVLHLASHIQKRSINDVAKAFYNEDPQIDAIVKSITKSVVNPADTVTVGWAAELVGNSIQGFMEELRGEALYARLAALGLTLDFGSDGSITIPGWGGTGTDLAGSFIGEGAPIPVKRSTISGQTMSRYKMAVISTFTKELMRSSRPQIEGLVRRKILTDTAQALDTALLDVTAGGAAVAGIKPASILSGAPNQASAGATAADVLVDLQFLIDTLTAANAGRTPVLLMHPSRALGLTMKTNATGNFIFRSDVNSGTLMGARLMTSTYMDPSIVAIVDASDFATGLGSPEFDVSDVATVVEANDDGTDPQVLPVGEAATAGAPPIRSLWQTWSTGLRMVMPLSWAMVRPNTRAYVTAAAW